MTRLASLDDIPPGLVEILDYIRRHGPCTRGSLAEAIGLSRAVITQRLAALIAYGLIAEDGVGPSTGGRAPRSAALLRRRRATCSSPTSARRASTSRSPTSPARSSRTGQSLPTSRPAPTWCSARVEALFDECARAGGDRPGAVGDRHRRSRAGRVRRGPPDLAADHAGLGRLPGARALRAATACPVWIDNDVNVMALGELTRRHRPRPRRTSSSSRSAPASAPGSSSAAGSTAARRAAPATSATSRSPTDREVDLPLRQHQLPRGARRRRRAGAGRRGRGARAAAARSCARCSTEKGSLDARGRGARRGPRRRGRASS